MLCLLVLKLDYHSYLDNFQIYVIRQKTLIQTRYEVNYLKQSHPWNGQFPREKEEFIYIVLLDLGELQQWQSLICFGFVA